MDGDPKAGWVEIRMVENFGNTHPVELHSLAENCFLQDLHVLWDKQIHVAMLHVVQRNVLC